MTRDDHPVPRWQNVDSNRAFRIDDFEIGISKCRLHSQFAVRRF